jgi:hypothetical protein
LDAHRRAREEGQVTDPRVFTTLTGWQAVVWVCIGVFFAICFVAEVTHGIVAVMRWLVAKRRAK